MKRMPLSPLQKQCLEQKQQRQIFPGEPHAVLVYLRPASPKSAEENQLQAQAKANNSPSHFFD